MTSQGPDSPETAIVTASYAPDFERCRLLCDTMDRHVEGFSRHLILVEQRDVALFRQLEGPRRVVVDERDILPVWLRPFNDPLSGFGRRIWLSLSTPPLRGWHVQQLRRLAIPRHIDEAAVLFCDSDVAFLRRFHCASLWRDGALRLFRREDALALGGPGLDEQRRWSFIAGELFGLAKEPGRHDYIATLIAWRSDTVRAMCEQIEALSGQHWVKAVAARRHFSECMIYGRFADEVLGGTGHFHDSTELCRMVWDGPMPTEHDLEDLLADLQPHEVAIGIQSFIGVGVDRLRRLVEAA